MVWVPYHLSGIWMGVLVSGQSFLQTITPHFSQSTVLDQSWSLTFSETITKSISVWTRLGTFLDLPDRLFCSSLLWKETKWTAEIKSTVCTETQPSDCIISAYWNTKGSWRSIKEKGTPSNAHALFVDPVASACILGEEIGHMLWKLKKEKKKKVKTAWTGLFCPIYVPFCHMVYTGVMVKMGIVAESRIIAFLLPLPLKRAKIH